MKKESSRRDGAVDETWPKFALERQDVLAKGVSAEGSGRSCPHPPNFGLCTGNPTAEGKAKNLSK